MESGPAEQLYRERGSILGVGSEVDPSAIRLAVVDRFLVVRQGVRRMLAAVPDIVVVCEMGSTDGMIDVLLRRSANVLLIDPELGLPNAKYVLEALCYRMPTLRIVIFTSICRDSDIDLVLQIGVTGYLMKSTQTVGLVTTIRRAANNSISFCDEAKARMVSWDTRRNPTNVVSRLATLSDREIKVLRLLSSGVATKNIALELGISSKTVDSHRSRIMSKLNIRGRVELCRFAIREGIITP